MDDEWRETHRAYRNLGVRPRLEVIRLAKRGQVHPDATTRAVTLRWARGMQRHRVRFLGGIALGFVAVALLAGLLGDDPLTWLFAGAAFVALLWWWAGPTADRIVRASEANGVTS